MKKKKEPAFGYFCTLNPDAGDVEKSMEIFNNSVADNISTAAESLEEGNDMGWQSAYAEFEAIVDECFPFVEQIESKIDELYSEHEGEPAWDEAYKRWTSNFEESDNEEEEEDAI